MKLTKRTLRKIIREEAQRLSEMRDGMTLPELKSQYRSGGLVTYENGGQLWDHVTSRIVNETEVTQRYMNNFKALYIGNTMKFQDRVDATEVYGSFDDPVGSMIPTDSVNFTKIV